VPYAVAAVQLEDTGEVRLLGNVVGIGSEDLHVGVEWADIQPGPTVPPFRPI
jgi:uncharacterized OB-fold protein